MELSEFLLWLVTGGGAGLFGYWLMDRVVKRFPGLSSELKRYLSLVIAAGLAMLAYYVQTMLAYVPSPETAQAWIEALFSVAAVAISLSQVVHGRVKLGSK